MTAGAAKIGLDLDGNDDRIYFYEDTQPRQIVGVCQINLLGTSGQLDSQCRYNRPFPSADHVFLKFSECTKIGC